MARVRTFDVPAEVSLGSNVRDTGTINIVLPETRFEVVLEDPFSGPWSRGEYFLELRQDGQRKTVGEIEVFRIDDSFEWFTGQDLDPQGNPIRWDETLTASGRTRSDSSRIIGQLDPDQGWSISGVGSGEAEWVLRDVDTGATASAPVVLTGGPPTLDQVVTESIAPEQVAPFTAGGTFSVASPITRGAEADVEVTAFDPSSGRQVALERFTISVPGASVLGAVNRSDFELPSLEFVEGRDLRICAELVDVRVT